MNKRIIIKKKIKLNYWKVGKLICQIEEEKSGGKRGMTTVWTISEERREELGPASLRLDSLPAFSKPNPTAAWQARLLLELILVWELCYQIFSIPWDLPALTMSRV